MESRWQEVCQTLPSSVESGRLVLAVTLTVLEIIAWRMSSSISAWSQDQPRLSCLDKSLCLKAGLTSWPQRRWDQPRSCEEWKLKAQWVEGRGWGTIPLMVDEYWDLDMYPTCRIFYICSELSRIVIHTSHSNASSSLAPFFTSWKTKECPWQFPPLLFVSMASCL